MSYTVKRSTISKVLSLMASKSMNYMFFQLRGRIHEKDFDRFKISGPDIDKTKYIDIVRPNIDINKNQEFEIIFSLSDPLDYFECKTRIQGIYDEWTGKEKEKYLVEYFVFF